MVIILQNSQIKQSESRLHRKQKTVTMNVRMPTNEEIEKAIASKRETVERLLDESKSQS